MALGLYTRSELLEELGDYQRLKQSPVYIEEFSAGKREKTEEISYLRASQMQNISTSNYTAIFGDLRCV